MEKVIYKAKDVIGTPIIAKSNGTEVGSVQDIIYSPESNTVESFILTEGGWFQDAKVLKMSNVSVIGNDRIMIDHPDMIMTEAKSPNRVHALIHEHEDVRRKSIITEDGQNLGFVTDIYFDVSGDVQRFEITSNIWDKLTNNTETIHADRVFEVGKDVAIAS